NAVLVQQRSKNEAVRQGETHGFETLPSKQANVDPELLTFPDVEEDNTTDLPRRRRIKSSLSILASSHGGPTVTTKCKASSK
ncbi:unnamed protein product, partial [Musa acuminata var. zebrina]